MLILGIETSCDETAVSLLEVKNNKIRVLSNVISSQVKLHAKYGGVVPSLAAREHVKNLPKVLKLTLKTGNCKLDTVDLIAITHGPGLISSLLVGTTFAKTLAWKYKKPIIGVNHLEGHIASNWLPPITGNSKFEILNSKFFPSLCLIVSGGHTELVLMTGFGKYKIIGRTLDDAAGEAFDKIGRMLGLDYPGGPAIAKEAERVRDLKSSYIANQNQQLVMSLKLSRPIINSKNFDFSFAGLKTAALYLVRDLTNSGKKLNSLIKAVLAAEAQQAIVDVLVAKTIRAAKKYKAKSIMLSGGVSANKLLRAELQKAAVKRDIKFFKPGMEYTTDNSAMIALAGYWQSKNIKAKNKKLNLRNIKVDANLELV